MGDRPISNPAPRTPAHEPLDAAASPPPSGSEPALPDRPGGGTADQSGDQHQQLSSLPNPFQAAATDQSLDLRDLLRTLWLGHHQIRRTLLAFGILSTLDLLLNLVTITAGIYSFKLGSFYLLVIALGLYCSLNLIFLFWYWFIDYPGQVRHLHQPQHLCQIIFPREAVSANAGWLPGCLDYLYFTVMTSNTLGAPENHSPVGTKVKLIPSCSTPP